MDKFKKGFHKFVRFMKKNGRWKVALNILLCLFLVIAAMVNQANRDRSKYEAMLETQRIEYEQAIEDLRIQHMDEIYQVRMSYEQLTPEKELQEEAECLAKLLYGTARNNSARDQRTTIWCALNRVDHPSYPNTVREVCEQPNQWMGYSDDNPVLDELYDIAMTELQTWHNNYRPVNYDYIYMSWSSKEIVLRDTYEKTNNTRYWQAG